jgi:hypothetical protein
MNANLDIPPFRVVTPHPADGAGGKAGAHAVVHNAILFQFFKLEKFELVATNNC